MALKLTSMLTCALFVTSCAGMGKGISTYKPPVEEEVSNSQEINSSFSETWDRMIGKLANHYFIINNVEKESRIINVSFSTDDPSDYIDCGRTRRTFVPGVGAGQEETKTYETATSSVSYKWAIPNPNAQGFTYPVIVNRNTELSGRTNIYLAPVDDGTTTINVNTRYVFTISGNLTHMMTGQFGGNFESTTISFNTNEVGRRNFPQDNVTVKCVSKGIIEQDIIDAAMP